MTIETKRLILRHITDADANDVFEYSHSPVVGPLAGWKPHDSIEETREIMKAIFIGQEHIFGIVEKSSGKLCGSIGLMPDPKRQNDSVMMLGYALGEHYWGRGYMTEAGHAVLEYAFTQVKLKMLSSYCYPHNRASENVLRKLGFSYEGTHLYCEKLYNGAVYDNKCFVLENPSNRPHPYDEVTPDLRKRLEDGRLYFCSDPTFTAALKKRMAILSQINRAEPNDFEALDKLLRIFFGKVGKNLTVMTPINASWGSNTFFGDNCFVNYNLSLVDDAEIRIGNDVLIAPNVTITSTGHAPDPSIRKKSAQFSLPVNICDNVWIGAGAVILPGVTIGENSIIGAGSIVTKDIPSNVVAVGNPCRVLRTIGEHDREFYYRDKRVDIQ